MAKRERSSDKPSPREPARTARAGLIDVARAAGVSHITVSRVINNYAGVRPETRERVLATMRQLRYRPNEAARALVTGTSRTIGVICGNTTRYGSAATLLGLEQAAREAGYSVNIVGLQSLDDHLVADAIGRLRHQAVAGIAVISPQPLLAGAAELADGIPAVTIWGSGAAGMPVVTADDAAGAMQATQHLIDLGHRTIWHLAGPPDRISAGERTRGWQAALERAGLAVPPVLFGDWTPQSGYRAGRELAADPAVGAVFAASDQMALGVLRAFHEAGRRVPQDISVVGFDDIPDAAYYTPPLTTVRQDFPALGAACMAMLLRLIDDRPDEARPDEARPVVLPTTLPTTLVIRGSTGRPGG